MQQKGGCNLAILAQALGAKRKSTTAVAKEVARLLNSNLDSCSS